MTYVPVVACSACEQESTGDLYGAPDEGGVMLECPWCGYTGLGFPAGEGAGLVYLIEASEDDKIPDRLLTGAGGASHSEDRWLDGIHTTGLDPIGFVIAGNEYMGDPSAAASGQPFDEWLKDKVEPNPHGGMRLIPVDRR